jgi:deoxyadenosine/deoxycytidine kinase
MESIDESNDPLASDPIRRIFYLSVIGNIGAGKTSIIDAINKCRIIQEDFSVVISKEPVDKWSREYEDGMGILELFYKDPAKWAEKFQDMTFFSRLKALNDSMKDANQIISSNGNQKDVLVISERCLLCDRYIFAQGLSESYNDEGVPLIGAMYLSEYEQRFEKEIAKIGFRVDLFIDVFYPPEKCIERIQKRNRTGEKTISLEYLMELEKHQCRMLELNPNIDRIRVPNIRGDFLPQLSQICSALKKMKKKGYK